MKRSASSTAEATDSALIGPTPGGHEALRWATAARRSADLNLEVAAAGEDRLARSDQRLEHRPQVGRDVELAGDDLFGAAKEPADALAEHDAEGLQQPANLVLQPDPDADQRVARGQQGADDIGRGS